MSSPQRRPNRGLTTYFDPNVRDRLYRLAFDHARPGRKSIGERTLDRLHHLLVVAGLRVLVVTLFVQFVTGEMWGLAAFNALLAVPVGAALLRSWLGGGHELGDTSVVDRVRTWRRRRRRSELHAQDDRL